MARCPNKQLRDKIKKTLWVNQNNVQGPWPYFTDTKNSSLCISAAVQLDLEIYKS